MKKLTYLLVFAAFFGNDILTVSLSFFDLYFYRYVFILLTVGTVFLALKKDPRLNFDSRKLSSTYYKFYFVWLVYGMASVMWAESLSGWLRALFFLGTGTLSIFYIYLYLPEKKDYLRLLNVLAWAVGLHNLIGWSEILTGRYLFVDDMSSLDKYGTFEQFPLTRIPISVFTNQNDFATMLTAGCAVALSGFLLHKKLPQKYGHLFLLLSSVYLIYRTGSRANLLGILIGVLGILVVKNARLLSWKRAGYVLGTLAAVLIGALIFLPELRTRVQSVITPDFSGQNSNSNRLNLILNGLYFVGRTFGLGVGAGNIEHWMGNRPILNVGRIVNIHNWWMEILTGYGIGIFLVYVCLYLLMIRHLWNAYRFSRSQAEYAISFGYLFFMFSFIIGSISPSSMFPFEWQWVFWGIIIKFLDVADQKYPVDTGETSLTAETITIKNNL